MSGDQGKADVDEDARRKAEVDGLVAQFQRDPAAATGRLLAIISERDQLAELVAKYVQADRDRRRAEVDAFVESLRAESAKAQQPILAADIDEVCALFADGNDAAARRLGAALLRSVKLEAQEPFSRQPPLKVDPATERQRAHVETEKQLLEAAGHVVQLNEDGTKIVSAVRNGVDLVASAQRAGPAT